jgi:adenine-specific DNA-methyltransferase
VFEVCSMVLAIPSPYFDERPTAYADRVGAWYLACNKPKPEMGQYFTPMAVANYMAQLLTQPKAHVRVLDPGAGFGILSCALCERLDATIELEAYEADSGLADCLEKCLCYAQAWMNRRGRTLHFKVHRGDFVLMQAWALQWPTNNPFDIVIANPPYFKLAKDDPRAKAMMAIVHGQPNIYALFMALGAAMLGVEGQLVFITPRSYAAGSYFSRFRAYFFSKMRPRAIHLFNSRREVFNEVLQESVILLAERSDQDRDVIISSSANGQNFLEINKRTLPLSHILNGDNILHIPLTNQQDKIAEMVRSWPARLCDYGIEVSTGPVVAFRATPFISSSGCVPETHAPLLWMQNIRPMQITWPLPRKNQYIAWEGAEKLLLPNRNYVVLRRFSAKEAQRRLTATPYLSEINTNWLGLENHLNYIHRPNGMLSIEETRGLAALLNSSLMDSYFRISNGNTQVSATELRAMPLPPLEAICEIGQRMVAATDIDAHINEVLGICV